MVDIHVCCLLPMCFQSAEKKTRLNHFQGTLSVRLSGR